MRYISFYLFINIIYTQIKCINFNLREQYTKMCICKCFDIFINKFIMKISHAK